MTGERCWYYHRSLGVPPERCTLPDGHGPYVSNDGRGGGHLYPSMMTAKIENPTERRTAWTEADHSECAFYGHTPNAAGTECQLCGLPAEPVSPADLADELVAEYRRVARWLD